MLAGVGGNLSCTHSFLWPFWLECEPKKVSFAFPAHPRPAEGQLSILKAWWQLADKWYISSSRKLGMNEYHKTVSSVATSTYVFGFRLVVNCCFLHASRTVKAKMKLFWSPHLYSMCFRLMPNCQVCPNSCNRMPLCDHFHIA